jgi:single-strand DNA-binding protein
MAKVSQAAQLHKNEVHLSGSLVRDPELRGTSSGKVFAHLTILTKYQEYTEYHRVTLWERLAEKAGELAKKGDFVKIVGRLQTRSWLDKQTNQKRYVTSVTAWQFMVPSKEPVTTNIHGVQVTDADLPL